MDAGAGAGHGVETSEMRARVPVENLDYDILTSVSGIPYHLYMYVSLYFTSKAKAKLLAK